MDARSDIEVTGDGLERGYLNWPNTFKINLGGLNVSKLFVDAEGPGGVKPEVTLTASKEGGSTIMNCTYKCNIEGDFSFSVLFDEEHVDGSPFCAKVEGEFIVDTSKVKVTGTGMKEGRKGQFNDINIDAREAAITLPLQYHIEGTSKADITLKNNANGTQTLKYKPFTPGVYKLQLKYLNFHVPGSPFQIRVK